MFQPSLYNRSIKKCIIALGTLFNNIELTKYDENGNPTKKFKVPLKYSSKDKLIQRVLSNPDLMENNDPMLVLPRMAFNIINISYDNSRKLNIIQRIAGDKLDGIGQDVYFSPAPYNIGFELNILSKNNDEALEIVEQILPLFQPCFFVTIQIAENYNERRDLSISLTSVNFQDNFESGFDNVRTVLYTLNFEVKTFLMNRSDEKSSLIKSAIVDIFAGINASESTARRRYTAEAKSLQDYNEDGVIDDLDDDLIPLGDDYKTIEIWSDFDG